MDLISRPENHPLVFHCVAGMDRTGVLAAFVLKLLGVYDEDVSDDYALTARYCDGGTRRIHHDPKITEEYKDLPGYAW